MAKTPMHKISAQSREDPKAKVSVKISYLAKLPKEQLRGAWRLELRTEPPSGLSRDLLLRILSWSLQVNAFGGHDRATIKFLDACARGQGSDPMFRRLKSGTVLIREYQGVRHTVTITRDGFTWEGRTYASLSVIARAITGARWNGPRFFGLRSNSKGREHG